FERIGDADLDAQTSLEGYRSALATQVAPDANERLRVIGKLLLLVTRSWGGVAQGPTGTEIDDLIRSGTALESEATDQLAIARFLIGRAFVPFWSDEASSEDERATARSAAQRGLDIAERGDDS